MTRPRKKPRQSLTPAISVADVQELWRSAGWSEGAADAGFCRDLAELLNKQRGAAPDPALEKLQDAARAAHVVLLAWCEGAWFEDNGYLSRSGAIHDLEAAR